jgi:hypothetical protein
VVKAITPSRLVIREMKRINRVSREALYQRGPEGGVLSVIRYDAHGLGRVLDD